LWDKRTWIADRLGNSANPNLGQQARAELLDLAILYADLYVRSEGPNDPAAHGQALAILAEAEKTCGPSCVLYKERRTHALALQLADVAEEAVRQAAAMPPRGPWEHYAMGRAHLEAGELRQAVEQLDRSLALEPQALWPQFARGLAAFRQREWADARLSFSICVALAPQDATCVYNRGRTFVELGRLDRAAQDFDRAAQLAPSLAPAVALSRADLHRRQRQFTQALSELERARRGGVAPAVVQYHVALVHLDRQEVAAAETSLREALRLDPRHEHARRLLERIQLTH
jgi:tetratricopeptide (TPR) repeat protein